MKPDFGEPPGLGLNRAPEGGLPGPPYLGLGFQPGFHPTDESAAADLGAPGLVPGGAPPARGFPLLVVKGRAEPASPRKGRLEAGPLELTLSAPGRLGLGRPE